MQDLMREEEEAIQYAAGSAFGGACIPVVAPSQEVKAQSQSISGVAGYEMVRKSALPTTSL